MSELFISITPINWLLDPLTHDFMRRALMVSAGGGSGSDINQATQLARAMVTKYGMSEEMGPVEYGENQEEVFLGRSVTQTQTVSEEVAQKIDCLSNIKMNNIFAMYMF